MPQLTLSDDVLRAAASHLGECVEHFEWGMPGAIVNKYILEAVLAVLCYTHNKVNPRNVEWTRVLLSYEFHRRLDGNNESMLLPPEIVRSTVVEHIFWRGTRSLARQIGEISEEAIAPYTSLLETIERLFPGQARDFMQVVGEFDNNLSDEDFLARLLLQLSEAIDSVPNSNLLEIRLRSVQQYRPHLLEPAVFGVEAWLDSSNANIESRLLVWCLSIEYLNLANNYSASNQISDKAEQFLKENIVEEKITHRSRLLNEIGNCLRYQGKFSRALEAYESALEYQDVDISFRDTRVVLRNRAIVLRDMHRYSAAQEIFSALRPFAQNSELLGLIGSEAICLEKMGERAKALSLLESYEALINGGAFSEPTTRQTALHYSQLLYNNGRTVEAKALADRVRLAMTKFPNSIDLATAASLRFHSTLEVEMPSRELAVERAQIIDDLRQGLASARFVMGTPEAMIGLSIELANALVADGRKEEAESILREIWDLVESLRSTMAWRLAVPAFRHAVDRDDKRQAANDLFRGVGQLSLALSEVADEGDPVALLAPHAGSVSYLAGCLLRFIAPTSSAAATRLIIAADLRAAPLLTPRLRRFAGLQSPINDLTGEAERLAALLAETPALILQFVAIPGSVAVLVTYLGPDGALFSENRELGIDAIAAERIGSRLAYALRRAKPDIVDVNLDHVTGWPELRDRVNHVVADFPSSLPLCIVSGPLGSVIPSLALSRTRALCLVPSIGALLAMRARRRMLPGGLDWRPRDIFGFAAWFDNERVDEAKSLAAMVENSAALSIELGLSYSSALGKDADGERLVTGLSKSELACISCHGRILPGAHAIDLIVASEGRLPPSDLTQILKHRSVPHVLSWERLQGLSSAPTVVVSTACNSGLAVLHAGGERLGSERPLFSAGTLTYVAPQWPVPTVAIQGVATALLRRWFLAKELSFAECVAVQRTASLSAGVSPLASEAFAVFGDGL